MKFAHYLGILERDAPPQWQGKFIQYKSLKKMLKRCCKEDNSVDKAQEQAFFQELSRELVSINNDFQTEADNTVSKFHRTMYGIPIFCFHIKLNHAGPRKLSQLADQAYWCRKYARANAVALRKILKKHDKICKSSSGRKFLQRCWKSTTPNGIGLFLHSPLLDELKAIQEVLQRELEKIDEETNTNTMMMNDGEGDGCGGNGDNKNEVDGMPLTETSLAHHNNTTNTIDTNNNSIDRNTDTNYNNNGGDNGDNNDHDTPVATATATHINTTTNTTNTNAHSSNVAIMMLYRNNNGMRDVATTAASTISHTIAQPYIEQPRFLSRDSGWSSDLNSLPEVQSQYNHSQYRRYHQQQQSILEQESSGDDDDDSDDNTNSTTNNDHAIIEDATVTNNNNDHHVPGSSVVEYAILTLESSDIEWVEDSPRGTAKKSGRFPSIHNRRRAISTGINDDDDNGSGGSPSNNTNNTNDTNDSNMNGGDDIDMDDRVIMRILPGIDPDAPINTMNTNAIQEHTTINNTTTTTMIDATTTTNNITNTQSDINNNNNNNNQSTPTTTSTNMNNTTNNPTTTNNNNNNTNNNKPRTNSSSGVGPPLGPFNDEDLRCPICLDLLYRPVGLSCGHKFCRTCALEAAGFAQVVGSFRNVITYIPNNTPCPHCRQTHVYRGAVRLKELGELIHQRYPEEWEERRKEERRRAREGYNDGGDRMAVDQRYGRVRRGAWLNELFGMYPMDVYIRDGF